MRQFSYITIGKILERLHKDGLKISRPTFRHLMNDLMLFQMQKTAAGWYTTSPKEAELIIQLVKENYGYPKEEKK